MEPVTRFPLLQFPTELVLLLKYAAEPTFSQAKAYDEANPYSSALALRCVSRRFRRIALPKLLHTISLPARHSVSASTDALRMQNAYAEQKHHLHFDYAPHVHRMWMVKIQRVDHPSVPALRAIYRMRMTQTPTSWLQFSTVQSPPRSTS
ncbi:hypothetical protein DFH29DRAFT_438541 [Suillus ampliporus]|nr:hypothetical protein DFH29DRAFT_438541 [Suillus ampliporus]